MTIVHVIEPFASGVTTAVINITRAIPEFEHVVVHGSRTWVDSVENVRAKFPAGVSFVPWRHAQREIRPWQDFLALWHLITILHRYPEAVIHLHSSKAGFLGRMAARFAGNPRVLYTPHCAAFIRTDISEKKRRMYKILERLAARFGGQIVGCGPSEAQLYRDIGIPADFVANGTGPIDVEKREDADQVSFVAIANHQKNPELFNQIAAAFEIQQVPFVWVGGGELENRLGASNIDVTGWVGKREVEDYLSRCLVYLSTAEWEGLPYGVIEAMSASTALLLHDVPGNRDLVEAGVNGFLFQDAEEAVAHLEQLLSERERTLEMGRESRRIYEENYRISQMGEKYRRIYRSMLS
ncbi:MAG TPA: glycosyltransferase [Sediminispirochaeta sp.]|nr:glycosyltransferase [Sediminispirochaeta sp.]